MHWEQMSPVRSHQVHPTACAKWYTECHYSNYNHKLHTVFLHYLYMGWWHYSFGTNDFTKWYLQITNITGDEFVVSKRMEGTSCVYLKQASIHLSIQLGVHLRPLVASKKVLWWPIPLLITALPVNHVSVEIHILVGTLHTHTHM